MWRYFDVANPKEGKKKATEKRVADQQFDHTKRRRLYRIDWDWERDFP